jgi:DNA-binding transcriptional ArsR family regulator
MIPPEDHLGRIAMTARYEPTQAFKALADPARLRLVRLVAVSGEIDGPGLIELSGLPSGTAYYHLRALVQAGLLDVRKERREHYYRSSDSAVRQLVDSVSAAAESSGRTRVA